ncbi:MAG TPA: CaiB/BaiF CoA-transferase family protein [Steroidobacteraceae bacterium]|nr:CaiB/BaiF CoA-transferase family protein [Steroidobacteraceae bacterium]
MASTAKGPLSGLRVLELGTMVAGPVAATLLGDFGAEVIKIEQPEGGDPIRQSGPMCQGESLWWNVEGRNKRSITLDLRKPPAQQILRDIARHADVLIENFRPGTMTRWGIGYEQLKAINPRLVMLSISGYGQTGPNAGRASYDRVALAFSGFLHMTGYPDRPPVRPGFAVADYQTAIFGALGVMLALYSRDARGGTGQHIDASLFETVFRFTEVMTTAYAKLGIRRERSGNVSYAASPGDHYPTNDGRYLALTIAATNVYQRLCVAIGRPELAQDPRFAEHPTRVANYEAINGIVADWIKSNAVADVCAALEANGVPHSLIYSAAEIMEDPHYAAREAIATIDHPRLGPLKMPAVFPRLSGTPAPPLKVAPMLGENTDAVLHELLGMSADEVQSLRSQGIVG